MVHSFELATAYIATLTGTDGANTVVEFRCIHDTMKDVPAHHFSGTLTSVWPTLNAYQQRGYGVFINISELDGQGRELANIRAIRCHVVDLDALDAQQQYEAATRFNPQPTFAVQSSEGRYHVYWVILPHYSGNERYSLIQRRLRQLFNGDKSVIDPTRVLRLPGSYNFKREQPFAVTCWGISGQPVAVETLETVLAHVNVIDGGVGERHDLGEPSLAAPSLDWLRHALQLVDPNQLDRGEWIALTSAVKQAGWTLTSPETLYGLWSEWCARYTGNDIGENAKQWNSIRNTELGWPSLVKRVPSLQAAVSFGGLDRSAQVAVTPEPAPGLVVPPTTAIPGATPPMPEPPPLDCSGEFLTHIEQQEWFKGCTFVVKLGQILAPDGRFHNASQFNGAYGGKRFIINGAGKDTDEAWKAALRSTLYQIPKVDHVRFLPHEPHGQIVRDDLGRKGVNMYKPAEVELIDGDPAPFLNHLKVLIPNDDDRRILIEFLAHNVRFPGYKIPWAPVIQSVEGAGKGVMKYLVTHAFGKIYVHFPNAKELTNSGSQFNAWMRNKLFILADEIKVDDRRDLIEVLKPMISETLIEVQSKGVDQELEDNYANWCFFTNYKDAVPVSKNGRRYAIFFSPLQTEGDLLAAGMDEGYFNILYGWLKAGGAAIVTNWLRNYPIERGAIAMRAPKTSSWDEAVKIGRSPIERVIVEAIEQGIPGFRGGWISAYSAAKRIKELGAVRGNVSPHIVAQIVEGMGYVISGRSPRAFFGESGGDNVMADLFHFAAPGDVSQFGKLQGWE